MVWDCGHRAGGRWCAGHRCVSFITIFFLSGPKESRPNARLIKQLGFQEFTNRGVPRKSH